MTNKIYTSPPVVKSIGYFYPNATDYPTALCEAHANATPGQWESWHKFESDEAGLFAPCQLCAKAQGGRNE